MILQSGVPTLDLSTGFNPKNVDVFGKGLKEYGFVNVVGHGVSASALARAYDVSKRTFELPLATKQKYEDPTDPANLEKASGRGLLLMRTFMDDVLFNETGSQVTLIKRRASEV